MTPLEIVSAAEEYLAGTITWDHFMKVASDVWDDVTDDDAWGLIFEIEHEPKRVDKNGKPTALGAEWLSNMNDHIASIKKRYA